MSHFIFHFVSFLLSVSSSSFKSSFPSPSSWISLSECYSIICIVAVHGNMSLFLTYCEDSNFIVFGFNPSSALQSWDICSFDPQYWHVLSNWHCLVKWFLLHMLHKTLGQFHQKCWLACLHNLHQINFKLKGRFHF